MIEALAAAAAELAEVASEVVEAAGEIGKEVIEKAAEAPKEIGETLESKIDVPKEIGETDIPEKRVPKEIGETTGSVKDVPREIGESDVSQKEAPKEIGNDILENEDFEEQFMQKKIDMLPKNIGKWEGEPGETKLISDDSIVNDKLAEYGLDGIKYNACEPDFSPVSVDSVKIDNMSSDLIANKNIAYKQFAEKWSSEGFQGKTDWTPRDVEKYKKDNNLDFHECGDMKTCQLVPHEIHSYFKHAAGRCACKIIEKGGMAFDA